jgi:hypothetical protein
VPFPSSPAATPPQGYSAWEESGKGIRTEESGKQGRELAARRKVRLVPQGPAPYTSSAPCHPAPRAITVACILATSLIHNPSGELHALHLGLPLPAQPAGGAAYTHYPFHHCLHSPQGGLHAPTLARALQVHLCPFQLLASLGALPPAPPHPPAQATSQRCSARIKKATAQHWWQGDAAGREGSRGGHWWDC